MPIRKLAYRARAIEAKSSGNVKGVLRQHEATSCCLFLLRDLGHERIAQARGIGDRGRMILVCGHVDPDDLGAYISQCHHAIGAREDLTSPDYYGIHRDVTQRTDAYGRGENALIKVLVAVSEVALQNIVRVWVARCSSVTRHIPVGLVLVQGGIARSPESPIGRFDVAGGVGRSRVVLGILQSGCGECARPTCRRRHQLHTTCRVP